MFDIAIAAAFVVLLLAPGLVELLRPRPNTTPEREDAFASSAEGALSK